MACSIINNPIINQLENTKITTRGSSDLVGHHGKNAKTFQKRFTVVIQYWKIRQRHDA